MPCLSGGGRGVPGLVPAQKNPSPGFHSLQVHLVCYPYNKNAWSLTSSFCSVFILAWLAPEERWEPFMRVLNREQFLALFKVAFVSTKNHEIKTNEKNIAWQLACINAYRHVAASTKGQIKVFSLCGQAGWEVTWHRIYLSMSSKPRKTRAAEEINLSPAHISGKPTHFSEPFVPACHSYSEASIMLTAHHGHDVISKPYCTCTC